jgi:hypothetical protein
LPSWGTTRAGAGSPTWKPVCEASLPDGDAPADPEADPDGDPEAEPDGATDAEPDGATGAEPDGATDADAPAEPDGATDADGAAEPDGATDADGAGLGLAATLGEGDGVGRRPTGSGPTKRNAASTPRATRTPARRPARTTRADLMRRESTSTDGPEAALRCR